jgi:uncharacterized protein (TIGR02594 family)
MVDIKASVGRNGKNRKRDVATVQNLLNANLNVITPLAPLEADGKCGEQTILAIEEFQRRALNMKPPDGVISPDGATMRLLLATLGAIPTAAYTHPAWLRIADGEKNVVERLGEDKNNPRILEYLAVAPGLAKLDHKKAGKPTGHKMSEVDETPWCACFVQWCLKQAGKTADLRGARAKDWKEYGRALSGPAVGAIAVLYRPPFNDSASGWHVGFWIGGPPGAPILLGGNQDQRVKRKQFIGIDELHFRWPN